MIANVTQHTRATSKAVAGDTVPVKQSDHLQTICDSEGRLRILVQTVQSDDTADAAEVGPSTKDAKVRAPLRSDQEGAICPACKHVMTNRTHVHLKAYR